MEQVTKTTQTAWYHLFSISKIRTYLTLDQTKCLILTLVTSHLDSNNSLLSGIPSYLLTRLQTVQNARAQVISCGDQTDHVTPLLKELHWLSLPQCYILKITLLIFKTLNGQGTMHLKELLPRKPNR